jgi:hypothetical protein
VQLDTSTKETTHEAERLAQRATRLAHKRGALETCTPIVGRETAIPLAARRFAHVRRDPRQVIAAVSELTGVATDVIRSRLRMGSDARRLVLAIGTAIGLTCSELCAAMGITRQAGTKLLASAQLDRRIVDASATFLSTDGWAEKVDKVDSEQAQVRGKFASGRRRS